MKICFINLLRRLPLLLAAAVLLVLSGCATSEPDNASARPWNTPKNWETGLPAGMFEGH